jgi:hypothetical protein
MTALGDLIAIIVVVFILMAGLPLPGAASPGPT